MTTTTLVRPPQKQDQVAALMLLVFQANPNTRMTRREIESVLNLDGFSESTRQRALNVLANQKHIRWETDGWAVTCWWMPSPEGKDA